MVKKLLVGQLVRPPHGVVWDNDPQLVQGAYLGLNAHGEHGVSVPNMSTPTAFWSRRTRIILVADDQIEAEEPK